MSAGASVFSSCTLAIDQRYFKLGLAGITGLLSALCCKQGCTIIQEQLRNKNILRIYEGLIREQLSNACGQCWPIKSLQDKEVCLVNAIDTYIKGSNDSKVTNLRKIVTDNDTKIVLYFSATLLLLGITPILLALWYADCNSDTDKAVSIS
jgi:hypothetical protein